MNTLESEKIINQMSEHYSQILKLAGADIHSEGLRETPRRAAHAGLTQEIVGFYEAKNGDHFSTLHYATIPVV